MNPLQQLMERRLWPVAALLVAALVAVPFVLKKPAKSAPVSVTAQVPPPSTQSEGPDDAIVNQSDAGKRDEVRAVLGSRKDPFRPGQVEKIPTPEPTPKPESSSSTGGGGGSSTDPTGSSGGGGGGTTSTPSTPSGPVATAVPTVAPVLPTYALHSLLVRFGDVNGESVLKNPKRLTSLGGGATPVLLYVGLLDDEKTAVFLVDAGVDVTGDGKCTPSGKDCQTLTLKVGETEFLTRGGKTWELDLANIITKKTKDQAEANHALNEVAQTANKKTEKHAKRISGYKYNAVTGFLAKSTPTAKTAAHHSSLAKTVGLTTSG